MGFHYPKPQKWERCCRLQLCPATLPKCCFLPAPQALGHCPDLKELPCLLLWGTRRLKLCSSSWWVRVGLAPAIRRTVASWRKTWKGRQSGVVRGELAQG